MQKVFFSLLFCLLLFFSLTTSQTYALMGCDGAQSICSLQPLPNGAKPGSACNGSPNYVYGKTTTCGPGQTNCVPRCGFPGQDAWCCDPKPGYIPTGAYPPNCNKLANGVNSGCASVDTALGSISTDPGGLVGSILRILLSVSGGVALLLIIAGGYQLMVSQGNPEKVKEARERITAAIVGLIFIIFSVTILQIIGVTILQLPGFNK